MFNNRFTKKDSVVDAVSQVLEAWDDDDEDDDVKRADAELRRMKAKPIEADKKTDPDKEIGKLAKKTPKEVDEEVVTEGSGPKEKQHTPYMPFAQRSKEGREIMKQRKAEHEQEKKAKAAAKIGMKEDKWTDVADGPWKKSKRTPGQAASAAANAAGKGLKGAQHKLDVAKPKGKLTAADFKKLRKEESELSEKTLTPAESKKKEEIVKSMKKDKAGLKARYGKRWKEVAYATATKSAKRVAEAVSAKDVVKDIAKTLSDPKELSKIKGEPKKWIGPQKGDYGYPHSAGHGMGSTSGPKKEYGSKKEEVVIESYGDMSHAAKELVLHADNHQHLFHSFINQL